VERQVEVHPWDACDGNREEDNALCFPCDTSNDCDKERCLTHIEKSLAE
jgi:hypothetical protein